jgi:chromatin structure-remodeling complex protein RSC7
VKRSILGGTKTGNGAWALAWVDTVMELPRPQEAERGKELEEVLRSVDRGIVNLT